MFLFERIATSSKYFLVSVLLSIPVFNCIAVNDIKKQDIPQWVEKIKASDSTTISDAQVSEGYLFVLKDIQTHIEKKTTYFHFVKKIYTEQGVQAASQIEASYDPSYEKLIFHEVKIIREGKKINKLNLSAFKVIQREKNKEKYIYDGSLLAFLVLEDIRVGDQIEYSYSIEGSNPIYGSKFFDSNYLKYYDPIEKFLLKIISSKNRKLYIKTYNDGIEPQITETGNERIYRWEANDLAGLIPDTDCPSWYIPYPWVQISEFNSWKEVKQWVQKLYKPEEKISPLVAEKIKEIKNKYSAKEDQIVATLEFIQNHIRYTGMETGIGAYKPEKPSVVFEQRFGDCKGKSLLFCQMMNELQVTAFPALISTTFRQELTKLLPTPTIFDHCVAVVEINGKKIWYDPTNAFQKGKYDQRYFPEYGCALLVDNNKEEGLVPINFTGKSLIEISEDYNVLDVPGKAELTVETKYYGIEADDQRYQFHENILEQIKKNYLNFYANSFPSITAAEELTYSDDTIQNIFSTYEKYIIETFWLVDSADTNTVAATTYANSLKGKITVPQNSIRKMPFVLEYPLEIKQSVVFHMPREWSVTEDAKNIKGPGVTFSEKIAYHDKTITINYDYKTSSSYIEAKEVKDFVAKQNAIWDELGFSLSYKTNTVTDDATTTEFNWEMLVFAILFTIVLVAAFFWLYRYDPEPALTGPPIQIGGWLVLPLVGLFLTPLSITKEIWEGGFFDLATWKGITDSTSSTYNSGLAATIVGELFYNIFMFGYAIFIIILFFKRRSSVRTLIVIFYISNFVFNLLDVIVVDIVTEGKPEESDIRSIFTRVLSGVIWGIYFSVSVRAKQTFVNRYKNRQPQNEEVINETIKQDTPSNNNIVI